jgi:hypothetical protein
MEGKSHPRRWTAIGRILGPRMPGGEALIGQVKIFPAHWAPPDKLKQLPKTFMPAGRLSFEDEETGEVADSASISAPNPAITSRWIFTIDFEATDEDEAERVANEQLSSALSALHLSAPEPYVADVLRLESPDHGYGMSVSVVGHPPEVEELTEEHVVTANDLLTVLGTTKTSRTAAAYIKKGVGLYRVAPVVDELGPSVLLNYFMAIEAVSDDVTKSARAAMEVQLKEKLAQSAATLRRELAEEPSDEKAIELIREAARRISRIQFHYADLKIERAGQELGLDPNLVDEARSFSRFRNTYLGHPRSEIPQAEIGRWFEDGRAFRLSNAYLRAYLSRRSS